MSDIVWTNVTCKLGELQPWPRNPRQIKGDKARRLAESFDEFGQVETIAIGPDNEVYNGHQRLNVLMAQYGRDYVVECRQASRALTEKEREKLTIYLHKGATGDFDFDLLANEFEVGELLDWGFEGFELGLTDAEPETEESEEDAGEEEPMPLSRWDVPDALWPTDNDWGVPLLDIRLQATAFDQPAAVWGATSRKARMGGTWLFYTEDYRYEALWTDPTPVLNTQAVSAVEPNFSAYSNMPPAVALWQIYRKRWIARWWQSFGVRVWVDLNVAVNHAGLNRLGVPQGWRAFATRGYTERLTDTHTEYATACELAGDTSPLFLVYGGGKAVGEECRRMGWLWMPEEMDGGRANNG